MKKARALAGCCALLGAAILAARADSAATPASLPPATPTTPAAPAAPAPAPATTSPLKGISTPTAQAFPVPAPNTAPSDPADLGTTDPERIAEETYSYNWQKQKTEDTSVDFDQAVRQRAYDNDWMLRGYAEQLKKRGLGDAKEVESALVAAPTNPNATQGNSDQNSLTSQTEEDRKKAAARRHDQSLLGNSDLLTPKKSLVSGAYQPLMKPFDQTTTTSARDPWGTSSFDADLTDLETSSGATLLPVPGTIPQGMSRRDNLLSSAPSEASLLDIPGLTAATQGAIAPNNALSFQDPGENETIDRQHPRTSSSTTNNNFLLPTTPTNDISDFFKKQAIALQPPTAPNAPVALVAPGRPTLPLAPAAPTRPTSQAGMGMRLHVDDPFDILRR